MEEFGRTLEPAAAPAVREPMLRAPWPAAALALVILASYALQAATLPLDEAAGRFGFSAAGAHGGAWVGLVTALFIHAGWTHAILNAVAALAFGAPVARLTGGAPRGVAVFFGFYLLCGAVASAGYVLLVPQATLIGASGAVSGLMGVASRRRPGEAGVRLLPLTARPVLGMALGWTVVNLAIGLAGVGVGVGVGGEPTAWQAHLVGYAAGLLLAPAIAGLAGRPRAEAGSA